MPSVFNTPVDVNDVAAEDAEASGEESTALIAETAATLSKTVIISWVEESHHRVTARVPADFDDTECDLANGLAELSDDGFEFVERAVIEVRDTEADPTAEFFDPPRYDSEGGPA